MQYIKMLWRRLTGKNLKDFRREVRAWQKRHRDSLIRTYQQDTELDQILSAAKER